MIVKGDGTLAFAESIARRPLETVLSGPAASVVGARWLSGLESFIVSDMGGTTTDVGILENGRPRVSEEGAEVGGWRTMVKAIDVKTVGLGGDSEVTIAIDGSIRIGPQRVVPVALLAARFPGDRRSSSTARLADPETSSLAGRFIMLPLGAGPGLFVRKGTVGARNPAHEPRGGLRPGLCRRSRSAPAPSGQLVALLRKGLVQISGFTPSDAAHVLGLQANWSRPAAEKAASLAVRFADMRMPIPERTRDFAAKVWSETVRLSGRVILDAALSSSALGRNGGCGNR